MNSDSTSFSTKESHSIEAGPKQGSSVYSSSANKSNLVFRNEHFGPLRGPRLGGVPGIEGDIPTKVRKTPWLLPLTQISEVIGPEEREILFPAIANGSVVPWHHSNLLGGYDFSDEKAPGFGRDQAPKNERPESGLILGSEKSHISLCKWGLVPNLVAFYVPLLEYPKTGFQPSKVQKPTIRADLGSPYRMFPQPGGLWAISDVPRSRRCNMSNLIKLAA